MQLSLATVTIVSETGRFPTDTLAGIDGVAVAVTMSGDAR